MRAVPEPRHRRGGGTPVAASATDPAHRGPRGGRDRDRAGCGGHRRRRQRPRRIPADRRHRRPVLAGDLVAHSRSGRDQAAAGRAGGARVSDPRAARQRRARRPGPVRAERASVLRLGASARRRGGRSAEHRVLRCPRHRGPPAGAGRMGGGRCRGARARRGLRAPARRDRRPVKATADAPGLWAPAPRCRLRRPTGSRSGRLRWLDATGSVGSRQACSEW